MMGKEQVILLEEGYNIEEIYIKSLSVKQPFKNEHGKLLGMMGLSIEIVSPYSLKEKFIMQAKKMGLSLRQAECLYFLMRGYTASAIAEIMGLSKRTVESYCDIMKMKLHCQNKVGLIEIALQCYSN